MHDPEVLARRLGSDPRALLKRLEDAKQVLRKDLQQYFKEAEFDFEKKRLVSSKGKFFLQWSTRDNPHAPVSYENQQTSVGTVHLYVG